MNMVISVVLLRPYGVFYTELGVVSDPSTKWISGSHKKSLVLISCQMRKALT